MFATEECFGTTLAPMPTAPDETTIPVDKLDELIKQARSEGYNAGADAGRALGIHEGYHTGRGEGILQGREEGVARGRKELKEEILSTLGLIGWWFVVLLAFAIVIGATVYGYKKDQEIHRRDRQEQQARDDAAWNQTKVDIRDCYNENGTYSMATGQCLHTATVTNTPGFLSPVDTTMPNNITVVDPTLPNRNDTSICESNTYAANGRCLAVPQTTLPSPLLAPPQTMVPNTAPYYQKDPDLNPPSSVVRVPDTTVPYTLAPPASGTLPAP